MVVEIVVEVEDQRGPAAVQQVRAGARQAAGLRRADARHAGDGRLQGRRVEEGLAGARLGLHLQRRAAVTRRLQVVPVVEPLKSAGRIAVEVDPPGGIEDVGDRQLALLGGCRHAGRREARRRDEAGEDRRGEARR